MKNAILRAKSELAETWSNKRSWLMWRLARCWNNRATELIYLGRAMSQHIVLQDRKIGHWGVDHRAKRTFAILGRNDVASPCDLLEERSSLHFTYGFIYGKWHTVPWDNRIENDVRVGEFFVHAIKGFDELQTLMLLNWKWWHQIKTKATLNFHARCPRPSATNDI